LNVQRILVDTKSKMLVTPCDPRIPRAIPHALTLDDQHLLVPHGSEETRVLRNLGYMVPSPVMASYDWGGTIPFEAQKVTTAMLVVEPRAYVLNTMGTGKTRSVLFAFDYLRSAFKVRKMLVVAPLSTLSFTWAREVMLTFPKYRVAIVTGDAARRRKILADDSFDIYVINHDGLGVVAAEVAKRFTTQDALVFDEVAVYRNSRAKRSKIAQAVAPIFGYVWGLTGTPTPQAPTDAYGILRLITPHSAPRSFTRFQNELMTKISQFKWLPRKGAEQQVFAYMQPAVRFTLEECVDMPPVIYVDHETPLSQEQADAYKALTDTCRAMIDSGDVVALNEAVLINKLLQVSTGTVYDTEREVRNIGAPSRVACVLDLVEANDRSVIVFCPYVPQVDMVAAALRKAGHTVHTVSGATTPAQRTDAFNQFQRDPGKQVIVAHPATMSHGLTLTAANLVIWYGPTYNLETYEQANARIARPGQTSGRITVAHLMGSPAERRVYKALGKKQDMQGLLLDLFKEGT
jgi:SNF2 family DNA or RNA helicase